MKLSRHERPIVWRVALILILALSVRIGGALRWQSRLPASSALALGDSESYWELGRAVARGGPYNFPDERFRVFRAPGYPLALAPLFLVWPGEPPVLAARILGALLGTLAVFQVWRLGTRLHDARTGTCAAAMTAVYPGAVAMSILVLSEALFVPLLLASVDAWSRMVCRSAERSSGDGTRKEISVGRAWEAGLWSGLAALTRPSWLLFVLVASALLWLDRRIPARRRAILCTGTLVGLSLIMAPWWVRNVRVTGHLVPTTLQVGASLYDGWNPEANGGSDMAFAETFRRRVERELAQRPGEARDDFEWRLDRAYRTEAWQWARSHPWQAVRLGAIKAWRTWRPWPGAELFSSRPVAIAVTLGYVPLLVAGLFALRHLRHHGWIFWLPFAYAAFTAALHVVFVGSIRYRQPVMVWWTISAAWMVCRWWRRIDRARRKSETGTRVGHEAA